MNSSAIKAEDVTSEALSFTEWDPWKSIPIVFLLGLVLATGMLCRIAIINYIYKIAPDRPINKNFLIDQALELPAFVTMTMMLLISYLKAQPIQKVFGPIGNVVFWLAVTLHNNCVNVGGTGIAVYRLMCIKDLGYTLNMESGKKLMNRFIKAELVIIALSISFIGFAAMNGNDSMAINFAKGHSTKMEKLVHPELEDGKPLIIMSLTFVLAFGNMLMELSCYINIFIELYRNDENIKTAINSKIYHGRRKRNAISLTTQVIGLALETASIISGALILHFHLGDIAIFLIICSVASAVISMMNLAGSGEMRNYYFN